jgi:PAS domain S-box-containing protein
MITTPQARLLIVDDEAVHLNALCDTLEQEGYSTTGFTAAKEALQALRDQEFDLLLTDLMMPEMDGISLLRAALEIDKTLVGIVMTGHATIPTAVDAMKMGALDYVLKPFKLSVVLPVIARALKVRRLRLENIQLLETVGIYELSMAIAFALDSGTIIRKMADAIFQQGDASSVSVFLPTPDGKELYVAVSLGRNADSIQGRRVPITHAISNWVARAEKLFSSPEELTNVQAIPASTVTEIASDVSIPMLAAGKLMGILNFSPDRPQRPVPLGRIKTLNILAGTAASGLHAASLLEELRTAEQRYRRLADNAPDIVFRYELLPQLRCVYMSPSVTGLTGYTPEDFYADPELSFKLVHDEDRPLLEAVFLGDVQGDTTTLRWQAPQYATIWMEQHHVFAHDKDGKRIAIEGIARDITERMNLEEQLRHSQRMEAVGRLAGGVAHDFNNLLTVIIGRAQILLGRVTDEKVRRDLDLIRQTGSRAAALTHQLLAFSRKQVLQPRVIDLKTLVADAEKLLTRVIGEDIKLTVRSDRGLGTVKADPGQMEQVIMNLVVNSRDAMPEGGTITIETANADLDESYSRQHLEVRPGRYVMLAVSDTGRGMDAETQAKIFEPFFTTKDKDKGTGLGLSTVYGIVQQSGGQIWVYSEPGQGTTFKIYLPRVDEPIETITQPQYKDARGTETILVVEDEEAVRELIREILELKGYTVLEAGSPHEAMSICDAHDRPIDLVITDVIMPGMNGTVLAGRLRSRLPHVKIIYMSGYTDAGIVDSGLLASGHAFLQKPLTAESLARKVREVLESEATA